MRFHRVPRSHRILLLLFELLWSSSDPSPENYYCIQRNQPLLLSTAPERREIRIWARRLT